MNLRTDLTRPEHVPFDATAWVPSPEPQVERKMLERDGGEVARATSIVRYAPGSSFHEHTHGLGEEFIVLGGTFSDEHGDYGAGTYVRNPPGSSHRPFSAGGCTIFVKLRQSAPDDLRRLVVRPGDGAWHEAGGVSTLPLHAFGTERVSLLRLAQGATTELHDEGGLELFVLSGDLETGAAWTWMRAPRTVGPIRAVTACELWLKQGHLSRQARVRP